MMNSGKLRIWLLVWMLPWLAQAGGDEVVVVYNSRMPESKAVADYYAEKRQVPEDQVLGFPLTTNEVITRADFTDFLQKPLAEELEGRKLWTYGDITIPAKGEMPEHVEHRVTTSKIKYAVLCYGVPLKIAPSSMLDELEGKLTRQELRRDEASVDSELAWLPLIHMKVGLVGPLPNPMYGTTNRDLLSPIHGLLLVTRLDGPTPEIARGLVDKAMEAEATGLWGRAYFDARNLATNDPYYTGDQWITVGAAICRQAGFDVTLDTNAATFPASFPMSQIAVYAGWYDENPSGPFILPKMEFMPGALAYHLHSYSAATLRSTTAHWCGPLLAKGATCTMGCVYEPYLQFTPNVAELLNALFNGYTFGQAAWASQNVLSWQSTFIGDPLYQPFGKPPPELYGELARTHSPLVAWSFERLVNQDLARGVSPIRLEQILQEMPATASSAVLTEKLAEIYAALGKPGSAINAWQRALTLDASPEQKIQLRRTLTAALVAQGKRQEAITNDVALLKEAPNYAGKSEVEQEIKNLTDQTADAGKK